jgi:hypothetical protein
MAARSRADKAVNDEPQYLYVQSARDDNRVALHEVDDAHPFGSVLVAGDNVEKVADTALVRAQLREGELVEVRDAADRKAADKSYDERRKAFEEAGMAAPSVVAGDRPVANEGRDPEAEDGNLGGGLVDPSRAGTGSQPTAEEREKGGDASSAQESPAPAASDESANSPTDSPGGKKK